VRDGRKQPIRGLWVRNGRFYAQITCEDGNTGEKKTRRVSLLDKDEKPVSTVPQAVEALNRLRTKRSDNVLPVLTRTPKFADYVKVYLGFIGAGDGLRKRATIARYEYSLGQWAKHIGGVHLDKMRRHHIHAFIAARKQEGIANRTINGDVKALRNLLKHAVDERRIHTLPTANMRPLKDAQVKRTLFSVEDLERLCSSALATKQDGTPLLKNGEQLWDYVLIMAYSGARCHEALGLKWEDVDFQGERLWIRRQVTQRGIDTPKNGKERAVDFNPKLKAHLLDMQKRGHGVSEWLFPSPHRAEKDYPAHDFSASLRLALSHAKIVNKNFHDLRHHFISYAVMSGVDFGTVASWVGHSDGGALLCKTYSHLNDEHKKAMAQRVNFGPTLLEVVA
jgi:integrase